MTPQQAHAKAVEDAARAMAKERWQEEWDDLHEDDRECFRSSALATLTAYHASLSASCGAGVYVVREDVDITQYKTAAHPRIRGYNTALAAVRATKVEVG